VLPTTLTFDFNFTAYRLIGQPTTQLDCVCPPEATGGTVIEQSIEVQSDSGQSQVIIIGTPVEGTQYCGSIGSRFSSTNINTVAIVAAFDINDNLVT
jgi:hypothetical protein